jgi:hypothetical protein
MMTIKTSTNIPYLTFSREIHLSKSFRYCPASMSVMRNLPSPAL